MKIFISTLILLLSQAPAYAQVPQQINYQGVARNSVGNVLPNKNITVKLSIRDVNANGNVVFTETRTVKTNNFGLFTIAIGSAGGINPSGTLSEINWKSGDKFLQVQIDPNGGWNYMDMGTTKLLSVPFAFYANSANPTGIAGGALAGNYPNPTIANGAITQSMLAPGISFMASGPAGGDLKGSYPNPTIANESINTIKLADNAVTTSKLANGSVTAMKMSPGLIPTTLPPSGIAGGDLKGNYPGPVVNRIQGVSISTVAPTVGQVLKFNGTHWAPAPDLTGGGGGGGNFSLPYAAAGTSTSNLLSISNYGGGAALEGINNSSITNAYGILGVISVTNAGTASASVRGINNGSGVDGVGIWGSHSGFGKGVFGTSVLGHGISGSSVDGPGLFGTSTNNSAGYFDISNASNSSDALFTYTVGAGSGTTSISEKGNGIWGITYNPLSSGVLGYNTGGGEAITGLNISNSAAAITGRNNGSFAGVQGIAGADNGIAIHALANHDGLLNGTALVAEVEGSGAGNTAIFKANGNHVARIDHTGKGFFNGGTQVGGADVAEYFDVEGLRSTYEEGDVLIISRTSDRTVEKSSKAYSALVAGVYATKPGLLLTERNAQKDELSDMVPMGVVGVIPTKVCIEGGAISRGDLIVTSSQTGVAMKADPEKVRFGQIIGKALQDFNADGVGKINVLVSIK